MRCIPTFRGHVYMYCSTYGIYIYLDCLIYADAPSHAISWWFMLLPGVECALSQMLEKKNWKPKEKTVATQNQPRH